MFAIGRSIVSVVLRDVVHAINNTSRHELMWPTGERVCETEETFNQLCGLPGILGPIDTTHVSIPKPRFHDLYVGMPGSTNDTRMQRHSSLFNLASQQTILAPENGVNCFSPYLIEDLGYPLLPWLMIPHKTPPQLSVSEALLNRRLRRGRCVVENAFRILKQSFWELLFNSCLHVTFMHDVVLCCPILHNILGRVMTRSKNCWRCCEMKVLMVQSLTMKKESRTDQTLCTTTFQHRQKL